MSQAELTQRKVLHNNQMGQYGFNYITDTTEETPATGYVFVAIYALEDTVINTATAATGAAIEGNTFSAVSLKAGQTLLGRFTAITLTSGKVIAYKGV